MTGEHSMELTRFILKCPYEVLVRKHPFGLHISMQAESIRYDHLFSIDELRQARSFIVLDKLKEWEEILNEKKEYSESVRSRETSYP